MKKILLLVTVSVFFISCGGVKKTQKAINSGNYPAVIQEARKSLISNKTKKSNQPYIVMLEDAFAKNTERELKRIDFLKKENNPSNFEAIYKCYNGLKNIQESIKPLLPLQIYDENREAIFNFKNYDNAILSSRESLSNYLYDNASNLLHNATNKWDYRKAYNDFAYLNKINPDYADSREKQTEAHTKGLDYVKVKLVNGTDQIIPNKLEVDLLNFNTYGINDLWTEYHSNPLNSIVYDYEMKVTFKDIAISPEQIREKQLIKEKQIKDGFTYVLDDDGNAVKDEKGNKIKKDKFKTVKCNFYQFTQFKSTQVTGDVSFTDLNSKQQVNAYPLSSEFIFEHSYANYDGDKRALSNNLVSLLNLAAVPFPSTEQMVYDTGEDLKHRLKDIIVKHKFN